MNFVTFPVISRRRALQRAGLLVATSFSTRLCASSSGGNSDVEDRLELEGNEPVQQRRQRMAGAPVEVLDLETGLYQLRVAGTGNITAFVASDGILLIDAGPRQSAAIEQEFGRRSDQPVRYVVNTHWHFDHTDGNGRWRRDGADIVAHHRVRQRLATPNTVAFLGFRFGGSPAAALPNVTLASDLTLHHGGAQVHLQHIPKAHTDGDVIAHFADANVIATGDLFFAGTFPFIDGPAGGSLSGMIEATRLLLDRCDARTRIIPGHGPLAERAHLLATYDMLRTSRDRVFALQEKGLSIDEAIAAEPLADFDPSWGRGFVNTPTFIRLIYSLGR